MLGNQVNWLTKIQFLTGQGHNETAQIVIFERYYEDVWLGRGGGQYNGPLDVVIQLPFGITRPRHEVNNISHNDATIFGGSLYPTEKNERPK